MEPKTIIATTTIRVPQFLDGICQNIVEHQKEQVSIVVIGDEKTPAETREYCRRTSQRFHVPIVYLDLNEQEEVLAEYPEALRLIPHNRGTRKFIGAAIAYLRGAETLIFVDDDNFATDIDFVGSHRIVGESRELETIATETGWFNPYQSLVVEGGIPIFGRGYPWVERRRAPRTVRKERRSARVVVNSGLVLEDPDLDAISRLFWPIRALGMKPEWPPNFALAPGTWAPFNDQNTAYTRELIPIYFASPSTGRNADIWGSYVLNQLVGHMGDAISFGYPLVRQLRNPHDLWQDLDDELVNDRATGEFVALLRSVPLAAKTYLDALGELLAGARERVASLNASDAGRQMMEDFLKEYQVWHRVFSGISRQEMRLAAAMAHSV